jgi:hypothetical protein
LKEVYSCTAPFRGPGIDLGAGDDELDYVSQTSGRCK